MNMNNIVYSKKKEERTFLIASIVIGILMLIFIIVMITILLKLGLEPKIEYEKSNYYEIEAKIISEEKDSLDYNYKCEYVVGDEEYITYVKSFFKEKNNSITLKYNPQNPKENIDGKLEFNPHIIFLIWAIAFGLFFGYQDLKTLVQLIISLIKNISKRNNESNSPIINKKNKIGKEEDSPIINKK